MIRKCESLFDLIRDATLVRIAPRAVARPGAEIWAQLELMLPGAMKDRVALQMIEDAEASGALRPGGVMVANIFSYDPQYGPMLRRLRETFQGRICWFRGIAGNNRILFAVKGGKPSPALSMQQKVARSHGLGLSLFNRLLAHWIVLRLRWGGPA